MLLTSRKIGDSYWRDGRRFATVVAIRYGEADLELFDSDGASRGVVTIDESGERPIASDIGAVIVNTAHYDVPRARIGLFAPREILDQVQRPPQEPPSP